MIVHGEVPRSELLITWGDFERCLVCRGTWLRGEEKPIHRRVPNHDNHQVKQCPVEKNDPGNSQDARDD